MDSPGQLDTQGRREAADPFVQVLGIAQDGGHPQPGCRKPCCEAAWRDPSLGHRIASLAILDPATGQRWMVDASPDFPSQLRAMDEALPSGAEPRLDGIVLTHAHIGHYAGLMYLGREAMDTRHVPVYAMPRLQHFLESSGPWDLLVRLGNIQLRSYAQGERLALSERIALSVFPVPHRGEYSETVGVVIHGPSRSVLYLPDVDQWEHWSTPIEEWIASVDVAYLDGTFFGDDELGGRSIDSVPHPRVEQSLERFSALPEDQRCKIRFIHFNHTNPLLHRSAEERELVRRSGMTLAVEGEQSLI